MHSRLSLSVAALLGAVFQHADCCIKALSLCCLRFVIPLFLAVQLVIHVFEVLRFWVSLRQNVIFSSALASHCRAFVVFQIAAENHLERNAELPFLSSGRGFASFRDSRDGNFYF